MRPLPSRSLPRSLSLLSFLSLLALSSAASFTSACGAANEEDDPAAETASAARRGSWGIWWGRRDAGAPIADAGTVADVGTPSSSPPDAGAPTQPAPSGPIVSNWITLATENYAPSTFTASGVVRYGYDSRWVTKTINGTATCNTATFGSDPAPGMYKLCQVEVFAPNVVQTGMMPVINTALMQPPLRGYDSARVASGGAFDVGPFDIGAFRTDCGFSHFLFDDPIVFANQPGKSHLHMFFGNTGVNAGTTASTLVASGNSTCSGGTLNRTGYWVPAMVNLRNGAPVVAMHSVWYYKSAYYGVAAASVKPFPAGLRMIAGSAANTTVAGASPYVRIYCGNGNGAFGSTIPNCAVGDSVNVSIQFPQCWDGVSLDSTDHKKHMAYASNGCPATHPVPLPEISLNLGWVVEEARPDLYWKLASDNYMGTGGLSMHADWFNGWTADIMSTWVSKCINTSASSSNSICDGRYLY